MTDPGMTAIGIVLVVLPFVLIVGRGHYIRVAAKRRREKPDQNHEEKRHR
jgi:cytochrome c-type biogenesis protein CcmH/NrfF